MSAYNDLLVEAWCPACATNARIRCQIHVGASSIPRNRGRFAFHEYRLGQRLPWWPPEDPRFESWRDDVDRVNGDGSVDECSYAGCESCGADLYVGVRFRDIAPVEIIAVTVERPDWCEH
jgi:hypothetical protein